MLRRIFSWSLQRWERQKKQPSWLAFMVARQRENQMLHILQPRHTQTALSKQTWHDAPHDISACWVSSLLYIILFRLDSIQSYTSNVSALALGCYCRCWSTRDEIGVQSPFCSLDLCMSMLNSWFSAVESWVSGLWDCSRTLRNLNSRLEML